MFKVQKRSKDIVKIVHLFNLEMAAETDMEDNKLLNKVSIFEKYSCNFIKLQLNDWCLMGYFIDVISFWALNVVVALLSMSQKFLGYHQKYLNLCSKDERRYNGFETTWGWVINDRIFIFVWNIPLNSLYTHKHTHTHVTTCQCNSILMRLRHSKQLRRPKYVNNKSFN